jgi:hypothetical protein
MQQEADIARIIQLAIAPVFTIAGIGAILNVLTQRLSRVVDRAREIEVRTEAETDVQERAEHLVNLIDLDRRMLRINLSITLCTLSALLMCLVIMALFTGELMALDLSDAVAVLFIAAMICLIASLGAFLAEISVAIRTLRVSPEFRRLRR